MTAEDLLVSPAGSGARLLQEHTPVLHSWQLHWNMSTPLDSQPQTGTATGELLENPQLTHSERLHICHCTSKPTTSFLAFPRSHLSTILASRCSAFFLKLLQWQLSIQLGNKEIIPLGKPRCLLFLKILTFPPRLAATEVLVWEITRVTNWVNGISSPVRNGTLA